MIALNYKGLKMNIAASKKIKKIKPLNCAWIRYSEDEYLKSANSLVHFSTKAVNSKAKSGGIRIGGNVVDIPYVCLSSVGGNAVDLDYQTNPGSNATFKQIAAVKNNQVLDVFDSVKGEEIQQENILDSLSEEIEIIQRLLCKLDSSVMLDEIDCKLKQIIVTDGESDFIVSPLHAAGLPVLLHATEKLMLAELNEGAADLTYKVKHLYKLASLEYGGAKPVNVGQLVKPKGQKGMRDVVLCLPPSENIQAKCVYSIHYNGINIVTNRLIDQFLQVSDDALSGGTDMKSRQKIEMAIKSIVRQVFLMAENAMTLLDDNKNLLPFVNNEVVYLHDSVSPLKKGLIIKSKRDAKWRSLFSSELMLKITSRIRYVKHEGEMREIGSGISSDLSAKLQSIIQKEVLL